MKRRNEKLPYIEIYYQPSDEYPNNPWLVKQGNLPKEYNGKKYRVYLEELDDRKDNDNETTK